MNSRESVWAVLAAAALVPACFETKVIAAGSGEGGGPSSAGGGANPSGGGGTSASGGIGSAGASAASFSSKECLACEDAECPTDAAQCKSTSGCNAYLVCLFGCGSDASCVAKCPGDAKAIQAAAYLASCAAQKCTNECVGGEAGLGSGGVSAGSGGKAGGGGSSSGSGGATSNPSGGNNSGRGGAVASGGATGSAGQASGISWLALEGNAAPASAAPNTELGIDGLLYGYSDGCATLDWDETTRCATGMLCAPGPTFANWGVAVGFDFLNTGDQGSPANTKRVWNPSEHGVRGVAWELTGTAPALQLWVLNMDPSHHGECNDAMTCDIAGPPDGAPTPQLSGQLLFSNMRKDDWGGSGIIYSFDPAAVHALQFKLPAVIAGAASFSFCINRIGVIR